MNPTTLKAAQTTVMILAAGQGKRMLPLTVDTPKPLLKVGQHTLIEHHLYNLACAGFKNVVINHAYLGQQIVAALGSGERFGLSITYSDESETGALETAGGIIKALPLISSDPFLVINGDIYTEFNFSTLLNPLNSEARLVLVDNPAHNPNGDFSLIKQDGGNNHSAALRKYTFSGIGLYKKSLFTGIKQGAHPLAPVLYKALENKALETVHFAGLWLDVGTPERLNSLDAELKKKL
jgi:MurNAc alpha-1-phosphate uridylyltransferase